MIHATTVARNYAEALLELAVADHAVEAYAEEMNRIAALVEAEPDIRTFLETPRIEPDEKKRALSEALEGRVPVRLLRFLLVVIDKRRQRILPEIAAEFNRLANEHFGRLQVDVTVAAEPDEALRVDLQARLSVLLQRDVIPRFLVNPRIIGGVVVRVGDRIMDGSLRYRLSRLRRQLLRGETR